MLYRKLHLIILLMAELAAAQLTPQQAAGKQIYTTGMSPSHQSIEAVLGGGSTTVPAHLMPCASCHGVDGLGRPEGGVAPSNITWEVLSGDYGTDDGVSRQRTAYDFKSLRRALADGIDSAGNHLGITMPQFRMSKTDLDDLIAYLQVLGKESDPGLSSSVIRIGTTAPASGPLADTARNLAALLQAYFDELNRQGGIYNRKIELQVMQTPQSASGKTLSAPQEVFAMLNVLAPGADRAMNTEQAAIPTIRTFGVENTDDSQSSLSFYLLSGLPQQAQVLLRFSREHSVESNSGIAVVYPAQMNDLGSALAESCKTMNAGPVIPMKYTSLQPVNLVRSLAQQHIRSVFFLGSGNELQQFLNTAADLRWTPSVFQPGVLAGPDVFNVSSAFTDRIFLAFPTLPSDFDPRALYEYEQLMRRHNLSSTQPALSLSALASAKVLVEGLKQAGRQLSRQKLVEALSGLYSFNTGLTPPVSYGPTRRIGALGAYVVKLDLKSKTFTQVDSWITP